VGHVEISGQVDVFQYWPHGASDVDTLKFIPDLTSATYHSDGSQVRVDAFFEDGGTFQADGNKPGEERFRSILRKSGGASFSVRLQGIDAPETHYTPNFREGMFNGDYAKWIAKHVARQMSYRQPYGKLSTDFFANSLRSKLGVGPFDKDNPEVLVPAKLTILADGINGAADVYGRIVGYVTLSQNGQSVVLNDLALLEGFAFCSFYGSMATSEMQRLTALYEQHGAGGARRSQLRGNLSSQLLDFEPGLRTSTTAPTRSAARTPSVRNASIPSSIAAAWIGWDARRPWTRRRRCSTTCAAMTRRS
jgi:endonuclease YncB( thermonuclease family)